MKRKPPAVTSPPVPESPAGNHDAARDRTRVGIAKHLDLSTRGLRELIERGVIAADADETAARVAYIRHLREAAAGRRGSSGLSLTDERAKREKVDRELAELKLRELQGALIRIEDAEAAITALCAGVSGQVLALDVALAEELASCSSIAEVRKVLGPALRETLKALADAPVQIPAAARKRTRSSAADPDSPGVAPAAP